jgi:DHA2 family multidrug resistance protein
MFGIGVMVGPTLGPTLGGWITDNYNWPWIFFINIPLGIIAFLMVVSYVRDSVHQVRATSVDVLGMVLLTISIGSLQWMLERGERYDWFESRFVTVLLVTFVVSTLLLIWRELSIDQPIINFRVLRSRQLATGVVFAGMLGLSLFGGVFVLPIFLQSLHGLTAQQTGMAFLPGALASAVVMGLMGRFRGKFDARPSIVVGSLLFAYSQVMLSRMTLASGAGEIFVPLILRGFGLGLIFVPLTSAAMAETSFRDLPQATALFNLMRQLGGSLGIATMATLLGRFTAANKAMLTEHVGAIDIMTRERVDQLTQGLAARGTNALVAKQQALSVIDRQITAQASVLAFSRIYLLTGILLCSSLPLLLVWKTGRARQMGPSTDH